MSPTVGQATTLLTPLIAKAQARVGELLQAKEALLRFQRVAPPPLAMEATRLLDIQLRLEAALPGILGAIQRFKAGRIDLASGRAVISFTGQMEGHLRAVRALRRQLGPAAVEVGIDWSRMVMLIVAVLAAVMIANYAGGRTGG